MFSLTASIIGMATTFGFHIAAWRMLRPASPAWLVPIASILGGAIGAAAASACLGWPVAQECAEAFLLFGSLVSSYLISLPALESESPSSLIVTFVDERADAGASGQDLAAIVNDDTFVLNRIRGLEADGLITSIDERLQITPSGKTFLDLFMSYHRLVGRRGMAG